VVLVGGADFFGLILELQPAARTPISVIAQTPVSVLGLMCIVLSDRCQCVPPKRQSYLDQRLFTVARRHEGDCPLSPGRGAAVRHFWDRRYHSVQCPDSCLK